MADLTHRARNQLACFMAISRIWLLVSLFAALLFWRTPGLLVTPRFWGEEGYHYYANLQDATLLQALVFVNRGNYQLLTNLFVYFASLFPAQWAAHVTTYLGLAVAALNIALLGLFSAQSNWHLSKTVLVLVAMALFTQGYEVYLSTTNVQWLCALSLLFVCVLDLTNAKPRHLAALYVWTAVCGLTGVPSVILSPIFLARRFAAPSQPHFQIGLILFVCAIVQAAVLVSHEHPDRAFSPDGLLLTFPLLVQTILSPLAGGDLSEDILRFVRQDGQIARFLMLFCALGLVAAFAVTQAYKAAANKLVPLILIVLWIWVTTVQIFGSLPPSDSLVSAWLHGRYFFAGAICFFLLLGLVANGPNRLSRNIAAGLLLCIAFTGVLQIHHGQWKNLMTAGKPWKSEVLECGDKRPCVVYAWPGEFKLEFDLRAR